HRAARSAPSVQTLQGGVGQHQPFLTGGFKVDLYPGAGATALDIDYRADTKAFVAHRRAHSELVSDSRLRVARTESGALPPRRTRSDFLGQVARQLVQEPRGVAGGGLAVEHTRFGIAQI